MRKFWKLFTTLFVNLSKKFFYTKNFIRGFTNWDEALSKTTSYKNKEIFNKTINSARLVRDGKAVYERDSVLFDTIQYDWPLLSSILLVANKQKKLYVVDFGGL